MSLGFPQLATANLTMPQLATATQMSSNPVSAAASGGQPPQAQSQQSVSLSTPTYQHGEWWQPLQLGFFTTY